MKPIPFDIWGALKPGVFLVEASAGTGKTWNIEALYVRMLIEDSLKPADILVVTFTEAATQELRERILGRLNEVGLVLEGALENDGSLPPDDPFLAGCLKNYASTRERCISVLKHLSDCKQSFDEAAIYTIHGFAHRILSDYSYETGLEKEPEILTDPAQLIQEVVDDYRRMYMSSESQKYGGLLVDYAQTQFTGEELKKAMDVLLRQSNTELLMPRLPDNVDLDTHMERTAELWREVVHQWEIEYRIIREDLTTAKVNRTDYNVNIDLWEQDLKLFLRSPLVAYKAKCVDRFTRSYIDHRMPAKVVQHFPEHEIYAKIEKLIEMCSAASDILFRSTLLKIQDKYESRRRRDGVLIYDDLLVRLREALDDTTAPHSAASLRNTLRNKYKKAMIDEFQDTDPVQFEIFRSLFIREREKHPDSTLFLIGDPKQAIYKFRGADLNTYLLAKDEVDVVYSLSVNYRSSANMVEGVNALFSGENSLINPKLQYDAVGAHNDYNPIVMDGESPDAALYMVLASDGVYKNKTKAEAAVIEWVCKHIAHQLSAANRESAGFSDEDGDFVSLKAGDIAILVASHKQGIKLRHRLAEMGVFAVEQGDSSVFDSEEARMMNTLLDVMIDPRRTPLVRSLLCSKLVGYNAKQLVEFEADEFAWSTMISDFHKSREVALKSGILAGLRFVFNALEIEETLIRWQDGERHLTNMRHLSELLFAEERDSFRNLTGLSHWLRLRRNSNEKSSDVHKLRLESDENRVQIITMHASKGLEFPVVYAPFLWTSRNPSKNTYFTYYDEEKGHLVMDFGDHVPDSTKTRDALENVEDRVRLTYVALTRARYRCYVPFAMHPCNIGSPLFAVLPNVSDHDSWVMTQKYLDADGFEQSDLLHHFLGELVEKYPSRIGFLVGDDLKATRVLSKDGLDSKAVAKVFPDERMAALRPDCYISSYSSIQRKTEDTRHELLDENHEKESSVNDELSAESADLDQKVEMMSAKNIFTFPKGAHTGNLWHEIFELIDFSKPAGHEEIIRTACENHGFDHEVWAGVLRKMVLDTLKAPLQSDGTLKMELLSKSSTLREMEFMLTYDPEGLSDLLAFLGSSSEAFDVVDLDAHSLLTGLIDLVFEYEGKFYILDYKSNYLGDSSSNYSPAKLYLNMRISGYNLQYHIYTMALHEYLSQRVRNYSYETHFGGVYYLYLRGIEAGSQNGIYFARPNLSDVKKLVSGRSVEIDAQQEGGGR